MKSPLTLLGEIDQNDLEFVNKMASAKPIYAIPAPYIKNKDGSYKQINPHESRFILENGKMASVYHIKPIYAPTPQGTWRPLYEVASYYGNKRGMTLKSGWENKMDFGYLVWYIKRLEAMKSQYGVAVSYPQTFAGIELTPVQIPVLLNVDNITVYPDPHDEVNTVDGNTYQYDGSGSSWATIIGEPGNLVNDTNADDICIRMRCYTSLDKFDALYRAIFLFNISSITGSTVSTTTFSIRGILKGDQATAITPDINVYSSAPASNIALAAGDFDSLGISAYCDTAITYAGFSTTGYNAFAFNANPGIVAVQAAVDGTGILKLGTRNANYDVSGTPPTWTSESNHYFYCNFADQTDTTSDPKLYVEYTAAASGPANLKLYNTNAKANISTINTNALANCKSINTNV